MLFSAEMRSPPDVTQALGIIEIIQQPMDRGKLNTQPALRPLAPNPMCFASTSATLRSGWLDLRCCAAESPANPPPTTATSANCAPDNDGDVAICESNPYEVLTEIGHSFMPSCSVGLTPGVRRQARLGRGNEVTS
jgi:hypothetical protein